MPRAKYKELWKGRHRLRQYVGSSVVKVTLADGRGTFETIGPLTADIAFRHVAQAFEQALAAWDRDFEGTPPGLRDAPTLAEVNARRCGERN